MVFAGPRTHQPAGPVGGSSRADNMATSMGNQAAGLLPSGLLSDVKSLRSPSEVNLLQWGFRRNGQQRNRGIAAACRYGWDRRRHRAYIYRETCCSAAAHRLYPSPQIQAPRRHSTARAAQAIASRQQAAINKAHSSAQQRPQARSA
jgi:hypothetical protein